MRWFTADSHLGHANIIKYCGRPFRSVFEMDKTLINNWNSQVAREDTVIHLGDFSFSPDKYRRLLNGKIILIRGNHDKRKFDHLFDQVVDSLDMKIGEFSCHLRHHGGLLCLEKEDFIVCGHVHEKWLVHMKNVNVGVDRWNMKLISEEELVRFLRSIKI